LAVLVERSTSSLSTFWLASAQRENTSTLLAVIWVMKSLTCVGLVMAFLLSVGLF
jgi:hypothetical protein